MKRRVLFPSIDSARCTGCGWCVGACPLHLLSLEVEEWRKSSVIRDSDSCTGCKKCADKCPFNVIAMIADTSPGRDHAKRTKEAATFVINVLARRIVGSRGNSYDNA